MWMGQGAAWQADMPMVLWGEGCTTGPLLLHSLTPAHRGNVWHGRVWHKNADVLPLFHFRAISLLTLNLDMDETKAFQVRDLGVLPPLLVTAGTFIKCLIRMKGPTS